MNDQVPTLKTIETHSTMENCTESVVFKCESIKYTDGNHADDIHFQSETTIFILETKSKRPFRRKVNIINK